MCNKEKCERKVLDDLEFFLDGHIDECVDGLVTIPREEYAELIAEKTMLRMIERVMGSDKLTSYCKEDTIREILAMNNVVELPPKMPLTSDAVPTAPGPDKEDAE